MSAADLVLATILLTTPPGVPELPPDNEEFAGIRDAIHKIAIDMEIMDPRESRYVLSKPEDFCTDLNMLRRRYRELADAPKVADADVLPPRTQIIQLLEFNRDFRKQMDERAHFELDRSDLLRGIIWETDKLYQVWDAARDARCEFYYITVRRQALQKLKYMLGDEAYAQAEMPPNVPIWRFNERR